MKNNNSRVIIEDVYPEIDGGAFPIKRVVGESVTVKANIFVDGHDDVQGMILYKHVDAKGWKHVYMEKGINDLWSGSFKIDEQKDYVYTVAGWVDEFTTWKKKMAKLWNAGHDVSVDLQIGIQIMQKAIKNCKSNEAKKLKNWCNEFKDKKLSFYSSYITQSQELSEIIRDYGHRRCMTTYAKELIITVDRPKALFSAWYEIFPRSWSAKKGKHGTFKDCEKILPEIARMGFDVLYFPPIHPIGITKRKGENNSTKAGPKSPGSPWAVGAKEGGHKAIHPQLGSLSDFKSLIDKSKEFGIEVAMDIAFQCSPDHPYVKDHPDWFTLRPDKTIQYAENPPKKYEDIYPINFESEDYKNLWKELKSVFDYWIKQGIRIFRVDNPHTKPFTFWDWVISEIRKDHPEVIFLSEAFTRPKVMQRLAKGGFNQSYTYFTWRTSQWDFHQYLNELTQTEMREYFRPNFWPNTPDILPYHLQGAGRETFMMRFVLAATLSSNYGMYGPAFELCVNEPVTGKEEYLNSEKYEIKNWDWEKEGNLKDFIARVNRIRKENPALHSTWNITFTFSSNSNFLSYFKTNEDKSNVLLVVVNLDPFATQTGMVQVPIGEIGIAPGEHYQVYDMLCDDKYTWCGEHNYVELNPSRCPAHILKIVK